MVEAEWHLEQLPEEQTRGMWSKRSMSAQREAIFIVKGSKFIESSTKYQM